MNWVFFQRDDIGLKNIYSYFKTTVDELDYILVGSKVTIKGQQLHVALGEKLTSAGPADLHSFGKPNDVSFII